MDSFNQTMGTSSVNLPSEPIKRLSVAVFLALFAFCLLLPLGQMFWSNRFRFSKSDRRESMLFPRRLLSLSIPRIHSYGMSHKPPIDGEIFYCLASWYGPGFHGKLTASGQIFNSSRFSAAHKSWPLGTQILVVNPINHRSVKLVINDRGPYIAGRDLDLSEKAARSLGFVDDGLAFVRVHILELPR